MDRGCEIFVGESARYFTDEFLRISTTGGNKAAVVVVVTFVAVGVGSTGVVWLVRRHGKTLWSATLRLLDRLNETMAVVVQEEIKKDVSGLIVSDCIVCLSQVSPGDRYRKLPNCGHGVQFHARCIESWLKEHSTCPMCRSHVPRPICHRFYSYIFKLRDDVVSYCDSALENVASSIGDCREF